MFGFLIKKTFFDMWDNLLSIIVYNLGFIAVLGVLVYLPYLFQSIPVLFFISLFIGFLLLFLYSGALSGMLSAIADYQKSTFGDFIKYLKQTYISSLLFALLNMALVFLLSIAFPVYSSLKTIIGPIASSILFWISVFWVLAVQYFYPVQSRLEKKFRKIPKKMFLLLLDNPLFSLGLLIVGVIITVLSSFTALLLPGISTVLLWYIVGLKLRLYKYDHLEKNPDDRKNIPWDALLTDDREKVGKRTLKGMIFPWKE